MVAGQLAEGAVEDAGEETPPTTTSRVATTLLAGGWAAPPSHKAQGKRFVGQMG